MSRLLVLDSYVLSRICSFLDTKDLHTLAIAGPALQEDAEAHLWRSASVKGNKREVGKRLWTFLADDGRRAPYVRSLAIDILGSARISEVEHTLIRCRALTSLQLRFAGGRPCGRVRKLPATLKTLDIEWGFFDRARFFSLLGTARGLESLAVSGWPIEDAQDELPAGSLPVLRSVTGSTGLVEALVATRPTVTSVQITTDSVDSPTIKALAGKAILDLDIPFEDSTIDDICRACPLLGTVCFTDVFPESLAEWLKGTIPEGWRTLQHVRSLTLVFSLMAGEVVPPGSAILLHARLKEIWPMLETVRFYCHSPWGFIEKSPK
ncbi:hypothetical protein AURDEDRAFT_184099 [Auricularia subglabra TFB-10046 SS5]|nr:hypothetical protein AURDEDRAFT_184099 [Auricularia subglabra TFB-10046 SS5]